MPSAPPWLTILESPNLPELFQDETSPAAKEAGSTQPAITKSPHTATLNKIKRRTKQSLDWATQQGLLLYIGLNNLSLARADLYRGILEKSEIRPVAAVLDKRLPLSEGGQHRQSSPSLLTRACVRVLLVTPLQPRQTLTKRGKIADRGPMRLFLADVHLNRARLFFRTRPILGKSIRRERLVDRKTT